MVREEVEFIPVETMDEVLKAAFGLNYVEGTDAHLIISC